MNITPELVDDISALSRLHLPQEEKARMTVDLEQIVGYMEILKQLNTTGVEPMNHIFPVTNVLREDTVAASMPRQDLLANAPDSNDQTFLVPKAVE